MLLQQTLNHFLDILIPVFIGYTIGIQNIFFFFFLFGLLCSKLNAFKFIWIEHSETHLYHGREDIHQYFVCLLIMLLWLPSD